MKIKALSILFHYNQWKLLFAIYILISLSPLLALSPSQLTLEEKVGQVLMVHFHGHEANEEARYLIQEAHIGGIIYYSWANELTDPEQVQHLSEGLHKMARETRHALPLLIAVDQEGGRVNRLKQGFTLFPGNYALGKTENWSWGRESARMIGQELKAVGISLNLAPVVDIYTNSRNPVIGIRAFCSEPLTVALWGQHALQGYKEAGLIACLKHFPGHGDVEVDSHVALPIVAKEREVLDKVELFPFRALASQADVIMTAHLFVPALDDQQPVTFSKKIVDGLLRNELDFQGVIMTDSLVMTGALSQCSSIEEAALKSLQAGHDLILFGGRQLTAFQNGLEYSVEHVKRIHHFLVDAVKKGYLSEERLDDAVSRILILKEKYRLFDEHPPLDPSFLKTQVHTDSHQDLAQQIAHRALHFVKGEETLPLSIQSEPIFVIAPDSLREELAQTSWSSDDSKIKVVYFKGLNPDQASVQEILETAIKMKQCVFFAYHLWQFAGQQELFKQLTQIIPHTIAIAVGNPLDTNYLVAADVIFCTFSPVPYSLQAAYELILHKMAGISTESP